MVDSYDDITVELLDREWERFAQRADEIDLTRLTAEHYAEKIRRDANADGDL